jgi:hypothetical protein
VSHSALASAAGSVPTPAGREREADCWESEALLWVCLPARRSSVPDMGTHADALMACDRGVRQAEDDFASGNETHNPFPASATMQWVGWNGRMRALVCERDHGPDVCCQEHRQHRETVVRSFRGMSYCRVCRDDIAPLMEAVAEVAGHPGSQSLRS